ncbi:nucleotide-binding alpha-beta plait domain-containing protein [Tanacetum coccineum]|uniref:Nucleotide-binding alpha-beta plait domain-containing protein n=1 Tax=Tanacetum coccineum TaxID=301880 RepID=A0ABQ4XP83_9ASTR
MGDNNWHTVTRKKHSNRSTSGQYRRDDQVRYRSKEDDVNRISTSIYVTNFPDSFSAKELFQTCSQYGHVVDSFIPEKKSKIGKRFGFVRFINVFNVDRLVGNLCTIWVNRFKLHANLARYQREPLNITKVPVMKNVEPSRGAFKYAHKDNGGKNDGKSYVNVVKSNEKPGSGECVDNPKALKPSLVLDDSCENDSDFTLSLNGKLKDFGSLPNLNKILVEEGFPDIIIRYLGGLWVLLQFSSKPSMDNFLSHVGANSWFDLIQQTSKSFNIDERVVWIDIEGVPLCAWSHNTFAKIVSTWGSLLYDEDEKSSHLHRKRICIKTTIQGIIFDSIKIIVKGKTFLVRVKELTGWAPSFNDEGDLDSDDESVNSQNACSLKEEIFDKHSDVEEIPETEFVKPEHVGNSSPVSIRIHKEAREAEKSEDPFLIYDLLNKKKPVKPSDASEGDLRYPPGFTPREGSQDNQFIDKKSESTTRCKEDVIGSGCSGQFRDVHAPKSGGSILQMIEDFIKVGQTMGYKMEGCMKDFEEIVTSQGACEFFK